MKIKFLITVISAVVFSQLSGCQQTEEVIIYTSHDRNISEPILRQFERETGIHVRVVYDTEANKTTGLVNRLIAERKIPRADVFWNNEFIRTVHLQEFDVLSPSLPLNPVKNIFSSNSNVSFTGFAARARVFIINTNRVKDAVPKNLEDLTHKQWSEKVAFANPHFGTTGTHFSALLSVWGEEKFRYWITALKKNKAAMLPGNAQVRDQVVSGKYLIGLTDTDDVNSALLAKKKVQMIIPGQGSHGIGVFMIPNTVSLVKGSPNQKTGKRLFDFLLQANTERQLANSPSAQIPILHSVAIPSNVLDIKTLMIMETDPKEISAQYQKMLSIFTAIWNR